MSFFKRQQQELDQENESNIEGERALASVNKGISLQNKITNWLVIIAVCLIAVVFLYKYYANVYEEHRQANASPKDPTRTLATTTLPPLTMPAPALSEAQAKSDPTDTLPPLQPPPSVNAAAVTAPAGAVPTKSIGSQVRERRFKREVRFSIASGPAASASGAASYELGSEHELVSAAGSSVSSTSPSAKVGPTSLSTGDSAARAYLLPDPSLTVTRGRVIPCTLIPAIDTTLTGIVSCVTAEDVTGANNKVTLMDRGTLCTGLQGGGVTHGQSRVGIVWRRCETPQHVLIPLESGVTDSLGRPGIPGAVDNHFWDRFGAAIALSLITDIGPYLIATRQKGDNNTTISFPSIAGPKEVITEVLRNTADIPPTITAEHGAKVLIYLAGDIDFRDVYQLERVR